MKIIIFFIFLFINGISFIGYTQQISPNFNQKLADSLGADEYGMKAYVLCILKTGPAKIKNEIERNELFRGHMANINRLADSGKLVIAGPFLKNDRNYSGLFILNVKTIDEAIELLRTDPTIEAKLFEAELTPWYGSAALSEYLKIHKTIEKSKP